MVCVAVSQTIISDSVARQISKIFFWEDLECWKKAGLVEKTYLRSSFTVFPPKLKISCKNIMFTLLQYDEIHTTKFMMAHYEESINSFLNGQEMF